MYSIFQIAQQQFSFSQFWEHELANESDRAAESRERAKVAEEKAAERERQEIFQKTDSDYTDVVVNSVNYSRNLHSPASSEAEAGRQVRFSSVAFTSIIVQLHSAAVMKNSESFTL